MMLVLGRIIFVTAQLNLLGSDTVIGWPTQKRLGPFHANQEADFQYSTLFQPN